ncbi:MAG: hypothetical protein EZS28_002245 [Streblomastix strix]|uniref:Uncharacterized protein n=1 Tax=Streblomastix strix TaxID=222440 RepID=A0A5J4X4W8_9EUKA|nr:MAG: hypothetical protein EZS28_002245 [Streblomastix strix]
MNQAQALKNLMENGTSIEYFNEGYIMKAKDKINVYEEDKKSARTLTQAQQTKLLLYARGGGQTKPKRQSKRQVEQFDDEYDEFSQNELKFQQSDQLLYDADDGSEIIEKPVKLQIDLEELIRLRTKNAFTKQQHQDSIKQVEKYKDKIKMFKQKKAEESQCQPQTPPQAENPKTVQARRQIASDFEPQDKIPEILFNETDLW